MYFIAFFVQKNNKSIFVRLAENAAETDPLATHIKNSDIYLLFILLSPLIAEESFVAAMMPLLMTILQQP